MSWDLQEVSKDSLSSDQPLAFSIYDENKTLILKEGVKVTDSLLRVLSQRSVFRLVDSSIKTTKKEPILPQELIDKMISSTVEIYKDLGKSERVSMLAFYEAQKLLEELVSILENQTSSSGFLKLTDQSTDNPKVDPMVEKHGVHTSIIASFFGFKMHLPKDQVLDLAIAAYFADIGKSRIPKEILYKSEPLTSKEKAIIGAHAVLGYNILDQISRRNPEEFSLVGAKLTSLLHHRKYNGTGYPEGEVIEGSGLKLNYRSVPEFAKITSISEKYAAMTSMRPYRKALSEKRALCNILREAHVSFDHRLVANFINKLANPLNKGEDLINWGDFVIIYSEFFNGSNKIQVLELARVVEMNKNNHIKPQVALLLDTHSKRPLKNLQIDLTKDPSRTIVQLITDQAQIERLDKVYPKDI